LLLPGGASQNYPMIWDGVPLGFDRDGRPVSNPGPAVTCILGPPGSGKTTDVTCNMLLDEPGKRSFVVADTKGTVHAITNQYRRKVCGKNNVGLGNPKNVLNAGSDKWNPINFDPTAHDFEDRCQNTAIAAVPETNEKQTHFTLAARSAMAGGIIFENREAMRLKRAPSLPRVRAMWTQDPDAVRETVKRMMATGDPAIATRVAKFLADTEELENIKSTIEAATSWMTAAYRADMETDFGVDFRVCRERPTTIYATIPVEDTVDKGVFFRMLGSPHDLYEIVR
jgi:type IV secretory pathway TraG/TraD family ATPase VirD4